MMNEKILLMKILLHRIYYYAHTFERIGFITLN